MSNEKDILGELLSSEPAAGEETGDTAPTAEAMKELENRLAALEKEKHGLLQDVKSERRKRQDVAGRFNKLTDTVNNMLDSRQQLAADPNVQTGKVSGIPVEFDDDGEGVVNPDSIKELLTPYEQRIQELENMIQQSNSTHSAQREAENVKRSIIGENELFSDASRKYDVARKWVVDQVTNFANENQIGRALTSGEALDYVFDQNLENQFKEQYPGMRLEDIVTAEDSQRHFRNALSHIAEATSPDTNKVDGRFQKVLNKPSTHGNQQNAKAGELTISEKVGSMDTTDILSLSDAQIEALMEGLGREERTDGIRF